MVSILKKKNKIFKAKRMSRSKISASSNSDLSSATDYPMTMADLICSRQWSVLNSRIMDGVDVLMDDPSMAEHAITEEIIVHFAVRFQAPLRTVSLLSELYPSSITSTDSSGRYPIHVACKWSATPDVINHLVGLNPAACGIQDNIGKTPMHYFAEFYIMNYQRKWESLYPMNESMMTVVKMLKSAAPTSVNLEDNDGCNAIEYALVNDVNIKVIKTMQRACRDDWRQRSKASDDGARRRHSDLLKDLSELASSLQEEMMNEVYGKVNVHSDSSSKRRNSMIIKISNGRVHVDNSATSPQNPTTAAARSA